MKVASYPALARQALLKAKEKVGHGGVPHVRHEQIRLLKAKEKVGNGGWGRLFSDSNEQSEGSKNCSFAFTKNQANRYIKIASYPALARQALLEDQGERFKSEV